MTITIFMLIISIMLKIKAMISFNGKSHDRNAGCYLPPDTSEHTPCVPASEAGTRFTYLAGWKAELI